MIRILLVLLVGVMLTDKPVIAAKVFACRVKVAAVTVVLCTFASARRLMMSFVITFHAAAVATSPAAGR